MMQPVLSMWETAVPYEEQSPGQARPSVREFRAEGADTAIIVCPGGGYVLKAPHEADPVAQRLNRNGFSAYVLDYRVRPCHPMAPLADAQRAIRLVRAAGYRRVGILGFSAGGHLACTAATHYDLGREEAGDPLERVSCRPDFFVACYPVVSFTQYQHYGSCLSLLETPDRHDLERYFSAERNVTPDTPPAFIWHTADDGTVPVENSLLLAAALSGAGVRYEMHIFPEGVHGLGLAEEHPGICRWPEMCAEFIRGLDR